MHHDSIRSDGISEDSAGPKVKGRANICSATILVKLKLLGGIDSTSAVMSLAALGANGMFLRCCLSAVVVFSWSPFASTCAVPVLACSKDDSAFLFSVTAVTSIALLLATASCSSIYTTLNDLTASRATQEKEAMAQDRNRLLAIAVVCERKAPGASCDSLRTGLKHSVKRMRWHIHTASISVGFASFALSAPSLGGETFCSVTSFGSAISHQSHALCVDRRGEML